MAVDFRKMDFAELLADGPKYLWVTQQTYENQILVLAQAREVLADTTVAYFKAMADNYANSIKQGVKVTTAKKAAEEASVSEYAAMIKAEQQKKTIQGYCDATRERLMTIKILMRVDPNSLPVTGRGQ
jgi:hypothetical protein